MAQSSGILAPPYKGVFPVAPTTFSETGALDLESQKRVLDFLIDQDVSAICLLANYSEQFSLSDEERDIIISTCLEHVEGRVPTIVTCSHFSTQVTQNRVSQAADAGASMIMLMPPYHGATLQVDDKNILEYFARINDGAEVPIMVQDAPLSGVQLSAELLAQLHQVNSNITHFKIETRVAAPKIRALIELNDSASIAAFDGEEAITLLADLDAGATGSMCSALAPELVHHAVKAYASGDRITAEHAYNSILPLLNFENRQCGLQAAKIALEYGRVISSSFVRAPLPQLAPETASSLIDLAERTGAASVQWGI